jgi:hypothetical protein
LFFWNVFARSAKEILIFDKASSVGRVSSLFAALWLFFSAFHFGVASG